MIRPESTSVLVVGAGPVGLLTALELARGGVDVRIVDSAPGVKTRSYALALHSSTLELLDNIGLASQVMARGTIVHQMAFFEGAAHAGEIRFGDLPGRFPFVVILPQSILESMLVRRLREEGVKVEWNHRVAGFLDDAHGATAHVETIEEVGTGYPCMRFERTVTGSRYLHARYIIGADGHDSLVRRKLAEPLRTVGPQEAYCLFEFEADAEPGFPAPMCVVLHDDGTDVLWRVDDHRFRWAFHAEGIDTPLTTQMMDQWVAERAPWFIERPREILWRVIVEFEPQLVARFGGGSFWLAGDAAHIITPIGVQSMNVGLREGRDLGARIAGIIGRQLSAETLEEYAEERRAEWNQLVAMASAIGTTAATPAWAEKRRNRIPALIPAAGPDLVRLLGQVGLVCNGSTV